MIPLHINVKGKRVLVIGGGEIAYRRLKLFLEEGASVTIVSPNVINEISQLASDLKLEWIKKKVEAADLVDAFIIIAATNDDALNNWIADHATSNQLVNVVSEVEKGNVLVPKTLNKGKLTLSVTTNGASPKVAKEIAEKLDLQFDDKFIQSLEEMYNMRKDMKRKRKEGMS
ncbi:precorrin-2 dehydrogenase/sirohydrochlorin ferrochelatase family protein [Metabacillus sp. HB246100]|uniref:precorrin-2 dehydrogenase/sirohydrochlorin ferrochelatase family protein n=1 Tax=Bacillus weihaiensis TaxID=1547283 RepID=UPI002357FC7C|nr:bifunctional precorrin-2 dehydrogenase/sirohydrochlorin ferrochelatase [Bacillus weihaiensis]